MSSEVRFFSPDAPYYKLTSVAPCKLYIEGANYDSVEMYFLTQKFVNHPEYMSIVSSADSVQKARALAALKTQVGGAMDKWTISIKGQKGPETRFVNDIIERYKKRGVRPREDWEAVKYGIMLNGLRMKFRQNGEMRDLLLSTRDATLIHEDPKDPYWGIGSNGMGRNMLGELLERVREEIQEADDGVIVVETVSVAE